MLAFSVWTQPCKLIVIFKQLYSVIDTVKSIDPPDSDISIA